MTEDEFATRLAALIIEALKAGFLSHEVVSGLETAIKELECDAGEEDGETE